ncbi:DUF899 domain-containing protein [Kibdelosporangium philippinense]|uniref:DUF899 domain-containing protein n=1 Tax=Kibdelosporangium philippinense TaxID=211113 RepID=A0ABS8ZU75_9PSEU|nr:DUF899 domain-containing protein [Kibdelosporangium philippinense]MCE7011256.1 DUF899 domain-containing protein [Kibdelosporangium philippinense]
MSLPQIVSRDEWLAARQELLVKEKAATRAYDGLNADRRRLPMVEIDKNYLFDGPDGKASLLDIFDGRLQLVIYHFMFHPDWDGGCKSCSSFVDQIGHLTHLHVRGTSFAAVSRAPIDKITKFKTRMGWTVPWYSSFGSDFNFDFNVTHDESVKPIVYNYRSKDEHIESGTGYYVEGNDQPFELPGMSAFLRDGDRVFHTYSTYGRGLEGLTDTTSMLDITALGRQEDWEERKGRTTGLGAQAGSPVIRLRDEYFTDD